jgi:hypothetical protein
MGQKQGDQADPVIEDAPQPPERWPQEWGQATHKPHIEREYLLGQLAILNDCGPVISSSVSSLRWLPGMYFQLRVTAITSPSYRSTLNHLAKILSPLR